MGFRRMYDAVYIPATVRDEFLAAEAEHRQLSLAHSPWIQVAHLQTSGYALTFSDLDSGEAEVLALAVERSARL